MCMTFLFLKNKNSSDSFNKVRTCATSEFFASEFMNICDDFQFSVTQMNSTFYSVCQLKYRNLNSYFDLLIFISGMTGRRCSLLYQNERERERERERLHIDQEKMTLT